jgi:hypothetical protein
VILGFGRASATLRYPVTVGTGRVGKKGGNGILGSAPASCTVLGEPFEVIPRESGGRPTSGRSAQESMPRSMLHSPRERG